MVSPSNEDRICAMFDSFSKTAYHSHSRCGTLRRAIRDIKSHDQCKLNGRKSVYKH